MLVGLLFVGYLIKEYKELEKQETEYDQRQLRIMENKQMFAKELNKIVDSLQEGILVIQNDNIVFKNKIFQNFVDNESDELP